MIAITVNVPEDMSRWRRRKGQTFQPSDFLGIHRRIDRPERTVSLQPASIVLLNHVLNVINTRARHYRIPTRLSMSPCCNCTNLALIAAMYDC